MSDRTHGAPVRISELSKKYQGTGQPAVDNVSLEIAGGEFITFLGPSGSGKTTTLNLIAGFATPTGGTITIDGAEIADLPPHRRNLGVVFQHYALFPHMSVAKNVAFPLEQRKVPKQEIKERVEKALQSVHLQGMENRLPKSLSGGQQQRVALARALVFEPPVLLMDEPFGALDKNLREELQHEVSRLHRELGTTFIFVTHDQEEALVLSDRIVVFNEGRIEQVGTPEELYETPKTLFVARFLGESNIFSGRISSDGYTLQGENVELSLSRPVQPESTCSIMVRPEWLQFIDRSSPSPSGWNAAEATVADITYVGSSRRVALHFANGQQGILRDRPGTGPRIAVGMAVRVGWPADRGALLDGEPAASAMSPVAG
ncbi:ABC transporter ATP-binding protein [Arthrobacter sp. 2MCAF15]|uniref:ABC transporter ATP-binding protein n=1 Tax=Arthrobacter sp. 2MCAF15 TaxID=3232984 RepID=UPI003F8E6100